ncbi:wsv349 [White spot syndrome virus]|uniref:Wsv349 n=1 Tax=White spot syndrome virus TaxID=342409 RepID=K7WD87_9VIRU|nr:wsv349 [White spot syndrome virus]
MDSNDSLSHILDPNLPNMHFKAVFTSDLENLPSYSIGFLQCLYTASVSLSQGESVQSLIEKGMAPLCSILYTIFFSLKVVETTPEEQFHQ